MNPLARSVTVTSMTAWKTATPRQRTVPSAPGKRLKQRLQPNLAREKREHNFRQVPKFLISQFSLTTSLTLRANHSSGTLTEGKPVERKSGHEKYTYFPLSDGVAVNLCSGPAARTRPPEACR